MAESWQLLLTGSGPFTRPGRVGRRSVSWLRVLLIEKSFKHAITPIASLGPWAPINPDPGTFEPFKVDGHP
jgi:hypothetical protein